MDVDEILKNAKSEFAAGRVFGTPIERDGVTIIPAAKIIGGVGRGNAAGDKGQEDSTGDGGGAGDEKSRSGGGFGLIAKPAGALIIGPGGKVRWKGFFDVNQMILGGQIVGIAFFLFGWLTERSKARAAAKATIVSAAIDRAAERRGKKSRRGRE